MLDIDLSLSGGQAANNIRYEGHKLAHLDKLARLTNANDFQLRYGDLR